MKKRIAKKQLKKIIGYKTVNGNYVVNIVSSPDYTGGTCVIDDEDCYKCEITYTRKRYGVPLCVKRRHEDKLYDIYNKVYGLN